MSWLTLLKWQRNWNFCSRLQPEPGLRHIHRIAFHLAACRCPRSGMNRAAMEDGVDGMRTDGVSRVHGDGQYRPISLTDLTNFQGIAGSRALFAWRWCECAAAAAAAAAAKTQHSPDRISGLLRPVINSCPVDELITYDLKHSRRRHSSTQWLLL